MPDFCVWVVVQKLCRAYLWAINSGSQYNGKERCGRTALWEIWWAVAHIVIYALYFHTEDNLRYDRNLRSYLEIAWLGLYEQFNILWYKCFVSLVAKQMTSNTVVAMRDIVPNVLILVASQFQLLWLNLIYSLPGCLAFSDDNPNQQFGTAPIKAPYFLPLQ